MELRLQFPTHDSGDIEERVGAWQKLLHDNKWDMRVDLKNYVYIPQ